MQLRRFFGKSGVVCFLYFFWFFYISLRHYCRRKKTSLRHEDISMFFFNTGGRKHNIFLSHCFKFPTKLRFLSEFRTLRHWIVYCLPPINFNYNNCFWVFWCFFLRAWITCVNYVQLRRFFGKSGVVCFLYFFLIFLHIVAALFSKKENIITARRY